ncbi:MiaB/RimO family radical SAM methylthiotransferase [Curtanaerobium respiraculi]|uniref:MiaB/RimO family radical SAM methylthiotransferase n=1 Tax=Curtanaerobium respiraculi TaxID=2949669 RepID=UPI0024B379CC|nr:MiaB/RimO family radical SAM methylthiotransferase [Curtanaerobium respiraculi]
MRFDVVNLGCKVNRVEIDGIAAKLLAAGSIHDASDPQVVVVNTCTVTGEAEKKTRKAVRGVLRAHADATVLVTGCAAAIDAEAFASMSPRVQVVGKAQVVDVCEALFADGAGVSEAPCPEIAGVAQAPVVRFGGGFPTRVGIKVQDGCNHACTYCIVHTARGREASLPVDDVLATARAHVDAGARELVLTGINLGAYASDGIGLADLVRKIRLGCPEARVRISSVEPRNVDDALVELLAREEGMVCRHLHLPLQAGSTRVLRDMARPYSAEEFCSIARRLYDRVPSMSLSTDIIVGFPGETDEDFERTLEVARACRFSKIHVFRYSKREGTPAAARADQVPPEAIARRARVLQSLAAELRRDCSLQRVGTRERVLVEADGRGTSESYFPVRTGDLQTGSLVSATLTSLDKDGIFCL